MVFLATADSQPICDDFACAVYPFVGSYIFLLFCSESNRNNDFYQELFSVEIQAVSLASVQSES